MKKPLKYVGYCLGSLALFLMGASALPYPYGLFAIVAVLVAYFFLAVFLLDMMLPWFNVLTPNVHLLPKEAVGEVSITFDDGPNPNSTQKILDILDAKKVKAAFFCIGENVVQFPEIAEEIARRGHILANHTQHHRVLPLLRRSDARKEIEDGQRSIERFVSGTKYLRFPKGYKSIFVDKLSKAMGFVPIGFSYPVYDVQNPPAKEIVDRVLRKVRARDILLFHDGCAPGKAGERNSLVEALPIILEGLEKKGLKVVPISRYF